MASDPTIAIPLSAYKGLVQVATHVSVGRSSAFDRPYPDAVARHALGSLSDAGIHPAQKAPDVVAKLQFEEVEALRRRVKEMQDDVNLLAALERGGVDNWEGYGDARSFM